MRKFLQCSPQLLNRQIGLLGVAASPSTLADSRRWKTMNKKKPKAPPVETERAKPWQPKRKQVIVETTQKLDPDFLKKRVLDDVWIREYYPPRTHTLAAAVSMHSELAHVEMTNNMEGMMYLDMSLDLSTKKKTKFIRSIGNMVCLPHYFQYGKPRRIMVISQSEDQIQKAQELGAAFYGGDGLIKMIDNGSILKDEFDYVIATPDMMKPMSKLKYFFKDRLPQKFSGNLTDDIEGTYRLFDRGVAYSLQLTTDEAVGRLRFPLGPLNLGERELLENAAVFVAHLCKHRPVESGPFITAAVCSCPPSSEVFTVNLTEYMPQSKSRSHKNVAESGDSEEPAELSAAV